MNRTKIFGLILSTLMAVSIQTAAAATHAKSVNVALIPNTTGSGRDAVIGYYYGGGSAGALQTGWFPGYNITIVPPGTIHSAADLAAYDTVILYQFCNINSFSEFTAALVDWLGLYGGKVLIWDSDSCSNSTYYSWLVPLGASFDRWSPGQTGNFGGQLIISESNGLGSSDPSSPDYINTALLISNTDAVGDLNVVNENTVSPVWCAHMRGVNTQGRSGFGHMYTKIGSLTGAPDALILYCGLDTDYIANSGGGAELRKLLLFELAHGWGPPGSAEVADLNCQAPIGNLALSPANAANTVGQLHTVTATVTTYDFSSGHTLAVPGVIVAFSIISGPNAGLSATGTSDANGQVSMGYTGSGGQGVDVIQAQTTVLNTLKTATAHKTWCNVPVLACTAAGNRGYYRLDASSGCYASADIPIYIKDTASAFTAGPFKSGQVFRIVRRTPASLGPILSSGAQVVFVTGAAKAWAVDPLSGTSTEVLCTP